jgi:hypothetical protein
MSVEYLSIFSIIYKCTKFYKPVFIWFFKNFKEFKLTAKKSEQTKIGLYATDMTRWKIALEIIE